ncbi:MAG: fumarylacetoacetase [Gemmatimonadota bacterium]
MLNDSHLPELHSWVESANDGVTDFPIQNLPYGVFRRGGSDEAWRVGVAIGTMILDVDAVHRLGFVDGAAAAAATTCASPSLNGLMSLGPDAWTALRRALSRLMRNDTPTGRMAQSRAPVLLVAQADAELHLPARVGDYTDFYASIFHATNVGSMFRPDQPLLPNYKYIPIGYHGRASSLVVSGTPVMRPSGQLAGADGEAPTMAPTARFDYEAELGVFVGTGNKMGEPIPIDEAPGHLFGLALLNDWSARDIQAWEYQPLGPFLAKSFATSVSPWVVCLEALAPYRRPAFERPAGDPAPLPYLSDAGDQAHGGLDITIEVWLRTDRMRGAGESPTRLSSGNARDLYWTMAQLLTHHSSGGCNLQPGDLLGSGTISGAERASRGSLLELSWRGSEPVTLPNGEVRSFLEDGDEVILRGFCEADGRPRLGFGECAGIVRPSNTSSF